MAQLNLPNVPSPRTTIYDNLLGVDFRADQTEVERRRSPMMVNMISDIGGNPIKRDGFRKASYGTYFGIVNANEKAYAVRKHTYVNPLTQQEVEAIAVIPITINATSKMIQEDLSEAILVRGYQTTLTDKDKVRDVFGYQHHVYISTNTYIVDVDVVKKTNVKTGFDFMSAVSIGSSDPREDSIIPLSIIGLSPDGTGSNASVLYGKNVMSIYQTFSYQGNGSTAEFKIPMYSKIGAWAKVEVMDANGQWSSANYTATVTNTTTETAQTLDGLGTATFSIADATVTISPTPTTSPISGEDNVRITVAPFSMDNVTVNGVACKKGYYNENFAKLVKSDAHLFFNSRLFLEAGEKAYYSEVNNPFMIPDNNYFEVGGNIASFRHVSNSIVIITSGKDDETIFLATPIETTSIGDGISAAYSVRPANASVGAMSSNVNGTLNDEPIFLASTGLYGLLTNWTSEKYAVSRSGRINRKLCKEQNLGSAVGCSFNGYYYLSVNNRMYVLDGRHKDNTRSGETSYECYYFEDMPDIEKMFVAGGVMYFTDAYYTYTWNSDLDDELRYYDYLEIDLLGEFVSGVPVKAYWSSVFDDDGAPQMLKTLKKKGSMAILVPAVRTGCYVKLIKNGDEMQDLGYQSSTIFTFEEVGFDTDEFRFTGNEVAYDRFTKKKIKKYKRLQIIVGNDYAEPFALTKVVKTYEVGNYAKR